MKASFITLVISKTQCFTMKKNHRYVKWLEKHCNTALKCVQPTGIYSYNGFSNSHRNTVTKQFQRKSCHYHGVSTVSKNPSHRCDIMTPTAWPGKGEYTKK